MTWNETDLNTTGIPYILSFPEQNELMFGIPVSNMEEASFNASTDTNGTISTTPASDFGNQSTTVKKRAKPPASEEYSYNEIYYQLPPSYNYDYGILIGSGSNSSASNRPIIPSIANHIEPISPYLGSTYLSPQFQAPSKVAPINGGIAYSLYPVGALQKDNNFAVPLLGSPYSDIQPRYRSPSVVTKLKEESSSTVPTKSFRTKMAEKSMSTKKRTQTTRRAKKTTSITTTSSKRFRAAAQQNSPAASVRTRST
uniref:Uncharacterized protein n=1 Tax=Anopheles minimus TaxID=112268 RepID=A0A182W0Y0_9DIPT